MSEAQHVYQAMSRVMAEVARVGIAKNRRNTQGSGYNFRGIDDLYNILARILSDNGLVVLPEALEYGTNDRVNATGKTLIYATVKMQYTFVSAVDGSTAKTVMYGEAMDTGDKAGNKAASAAQKYALLQAFCVPTEGDNDSENETHELASLSPEQAQWFQTLQQAAMSGNDELGDAYDRIVSSLNEEQSEALAVLWETEGQKLTDIAESADAQREAEGHRQ